jgi:hypothetical protein
MVNTGQMLLVLGAMLLFSLMLPSLNGTILYNDSALVTAQVQTNAIALAQRYLSEAGTKVFDEACVSGHPTSPSQMTPAAFLGKGPSEYYPYFDDIDDYDDLNLTDSTTLASVRYTITGRVTYADPNNPANNSATQTFLKRVRITVLSPFLIDPVSRVATPIYIEQLFAYY